MDYIELVKQTDLRYWFPAVQKSGVLYPKTVLVVADLRELLPVLDGKPSVPFKNLLRAITERSVEVGVPFFIRTAYLSGKHDWDRSCYCWTLSGLPTRIHSLLEHTVLADQPLGCFVLREFLILHSLFSAFRGMPVAREFRVFIKDREVLHVQPYWPPPSIRNPSTPDWEEKLAELSYLNEYEETELEECARSVDIEGFWSVDFAQTVNGDWYLIDMARGELSYCWFPERDHAEEGTTGVELLKENV